MKVRVLVTPKPGVLDPEGRAIRSALRDLGYGAVANVRTGKVVTLELDGLEPQSAAALAREMCEKLLANPVIEQYDLELLEEDPERGPSGA